LADFPLPLADIPSSLADFPLPLADSLLPLADISPVWLIPFSFWLIYTSLS
jgi:hypothetical protein